MLGELQHAGRAAPEPSSNDLQNLAGAEARWRALAEDGRLREAATAAAEMVSLSLALGQTSLIEEAGSFLLDESTPTTNTVRRAVRRVQSPVDRDTPQLALESTDLSVTLHETRRRIAGLKSRVRQSPHSALAWIELARQYAILGQKDESRRAAEIALALAPANRYVLRSVARMHTLRDDAEQGHALVLPIAKATGDPWLIASEMALAAEAGRSSKLRRQAVLLLKRWGEDPFHVSELASELGTAELAAGNDRRARQLLRQALANPNENALAQVEWIHVRVPSVHVDPAALLGTHSFEARARDAQREQRWQDAFHNAEQWLYDQPFSIDAASTATYLASTALQDYDGAIRTGQVGVGANPQSALLHNNLAYAMAMRDRLAEASEHVRLGTALARGPVDTALLLATEGLVRFREGQTIEGRRRYEDAIGLARTRNLGELEALATVHLAREELLAGADHGAELGREAIALAQSLKPELQGLVRQLQRLVEGPHRES